jgi:hypothetical protein
MLSVRFGSVQRIKNFYRFPFGLNSQKLEPIPSLESTHQRRGCIFIFITAVARLTGLITLVSLVFLTYLEWLVIDSMNFEIYVTYVFEFVFSEEKKKQPNQIFGRIVTIIVGYLEVLWILDKCITCCICCFR